MASDEMLSTCPCSSPYLVKSNVSTLISTLIAGMHETDVMVAHHGFDLELTVAWHDHHQGLGGRHHAADRVYGQLLNHARHRRGQLLKLGALLGLDRSWPKAAAFRSASVSRRTAFGDTRPWSGRVFR